MDCAVRIVYSYSYSFEYVFVFMWRRSAADRATGAEHAVLPAAAARDGPDRVRQRGQPGGAAHALRARQNEVRCPSAPLLLSTSPPDFSVVRA